MHPKKRLGLGLIVLAAILLIAALDEEGIIAGYLLVRRVALVSSARGRQTLACCLMHTIISRTKLAQNMIDGIIIYFFVDPTENVGAREAQRPPPGHPPVDASGSGACPYASTVGL